ncbi:hypothetical protein Rhe02_22740 [Rhizocola hellebori]|uniref:PadR family transcriptional regulator n=1 Tax=Rhizocola hellebori TaxID=1392758 RepID=A0A8J3Q6J8_9ACTN|nr:GyrI-like domain-containing protein [Rhizocola hellebori]GIH04207.1 hypothetical protein Rhe02_22740 [Rhizocola hellebori]
MPRPLTAAELALLGLLAERPRHGYELEEVIVERGMRDWTEIGFSSIYYVLARLHERGLVDERAAPSARGKPRKVYAPTPAGLRALAEAAEAVLANLVPVPAPLLLGLANQPALPPQRFAAALARRADALADRVAAVQAAADAQSDAPDFVRAIFDFSLGQLMAEQRWLTAYRESLGGKKVTAYDVKKELKNLYAPRNADWALVDVPPLAYLAVDGEGDPNTAQAYREAVEALYSVAYTIKFASKDRPFVVAPLEGLWWADDPSVFVSRDKAAWKWTMLIGLPPWITQEQVQESKNQALAKKKLPAIDRVRLDQLHEGTSAQLLHVGSYDDEAPKLAALHSEYLAAQGLQLNGQHHEIYLSDPRRTEPAKLKTILRQPVKPRE